MIVASNANNDLKYHYLERIYTHGMLEDEVGYDLTCGDTNLFERIQAFKEGSETSLIRFEIFKVNGSEQSVVMYIWKGKETNFTMGLVVYPDDIEALEYATMKKNARVDCL